MRHIPAATPETAQVFAHPHPQKPVRFPAGQSECFHPAKPSFYPPAVTAGITHYTLQAKPCAKGASPLETPVLSGSRYSPRKSAAAPLPSKTQTGGIGQPVPGADLCRLLILMGAYCIAHINRSNLSLLYGSFFWQFGIFQNDTFVYLWGVMMCTLPFLKVHSFFRLEL